MKNKIDINEVEQLREENKRLQVADLYFNMDEANGKVVNIGHANEISIGGLARKILDLCGRNDIAIRFDTDKPDGYPRRAADTTLLQQLIGQVPDRPIEETLSDMIKEYDAKSQCNNRS